MSRAGYSDDLVNTWDLIRYRGAVASAIRGKRGQAFLKETLAAIQSLPTPTLARDSLQTPTGEVCTLGATFRHRNIDTTEIDPYDYDTVAATLGIVPALVREIAYENDINYPLSEQRYDRMQRWLQANIKDHQP